jgi:hypothetical protein
MGMLGRVGGLFQAVSTPATTQKAGEEADKVANPEVTKDKEYETEVVAAVGSSGPG